MRRFLPHLGIALGLLLVAYALWWSDSDEDQIRAKLEAIEEVAEVGRGPTNPLLRAAELRKRLAGICIKDVRIRIAELTEVTRGRDELVRLAAAAPQLYRTVEVDLSDLAVEVDRSARSAAAHGPATLTAVEHGGRVRRDRREVMLRFDKIEGDWRLVSIRVSSPAQAGQP